jgi:hypothetical protein
MKLGFWTICFALLLCSSAPAQSRGLIGTNGSFYESAFCKKYKCSLTVRRQLSTSLEEWSYTYNSGSQDNTVSVLRSKGLIIGASIEMGVQDDPFIVCCFSPVARSLVQAMTGITIADSEFRSLGEAASGVFGKEILSSLSSRGSMAFLSVGYFAYIEPANSNRFVFRVSL